MAYSEEIQARLTEINEVKTIAGFFANLIIQKHIEWRATGVDYTAESLVAGTPYEGLVEISGNTVVLHTPGQQYVWVYIARNGDETANLKEFCGFDL